LWHCDYNVLSANHHNLIILSKEKARAKSRREIEFTFGECIAFVNVKPCICAFVHLCKGLGRKKYVQGFEETFRDCNCNIVNTRACTSIVGLGGLLNVLKDNSTYIL